MELVWISDSDSKAYLKQRKLAGYWTLTIETRLLKANRLGTVVPSYEDGTCYPKLAFFRFNEDCAAIEWRVETLQCRMWILIPAVTEQEIVARVRLLIELFALHLDFENVGLSVEDEPNELNLKSVDAMQRLQIQNVISNSVKLIRLSLRDRNRAF